VLREVVPAGSSPVVDTLRGASFVFVLLGEALGQVDEGWTLPNRRVVTAE
jgi:hypothetical protein